MQCTLPMTVNLTNMDPSLPATFYDTRPELKAIAPTEVSDRILVFHRGVQQERRVHKDIQKRLQMFVEYVIIYPLMGAILFLLAKLNVLVRRRLVPARRAYTITAIMTHSFKAGGLARPWSGCKTPCLTTTLL